MDQHYCKTFQTTIYLSVIILRKISHCAHCSLSHLRNEIASYEWSDKSRTSTTVKYFRQRYMLVSSFYDRLQLSNHLRNRIILCYNRDITGKYFAIVHIPPFHISKMKLLFKSSLRFWKITKLNTRWLHNDSESN